jgi:hypothetical protein
MSRRDLVLGAGMLAGAAIAPAAVMQHGDRPRDVGRKFFADGRVMPFAGNTIICHLPQQGAGSEAFAALLDIYRDLPRHGFARKMTALPPSSYHMTVIGGANDKDRRRPLWPEGVPLDASMADCDAVLAARLREVRLGEAAGPYRMKVDMTEPGATELPLTIRLVPADAETQAKLHQARAIIGAAIGIPVRQPDRYGFHITLGYAIHWLDADENAAFRAVLAEWKRAIAKRAPVISLGAPEYCLLDDMFHFARQFYLA